MTKQLITLLLSVLPVAAQGHIELPFDLAWNTKKIHLYDRDIRFSSCLNTDTHSLCRAMKPDEIFFLAREILFVFSLNDGYLDKLEIETKYTYDDLSGQHGRDIYQHMKGWAKMQNASETYEYYSLSGIPYPDINTFYECLDYLGCASYSSYDKDSNNNSAMVKLLSHSKDQGFIKIQYESSRYAQQTQPR